MSLWRRQSWSAVAAGACLLVGCGGPSGPVDENRSERGSEPDAAQREGNGALAEAPQRLVDECQALGASRTVRVLCPRRLPEARWVIAHRTLRAGRCQYLIDWNTKPLGTGKAFHLLAGGRCTPFPLDTVDERWPPDARMPRDLGLVGTKPLEPGEKHESEDRVRLRLVRRARVGERDALLLRAEPHRSGGGVHGGHLAVVWNERQAGYVLTLHFSVENGATAVQKESAVLAAAEAMSGG